MHKILIKLFIKDYNNLSSPKVRAAYGALAGIVGIISNILLAGLKIIIGILAISPSIIADGINNLTDGVSSIITLVGFKLSSKQADSDHPYGHQRLEYITGLIIAFIIFIIGITLLKDSIVGVYELFTGQAKALDIVNPVVIIGCLVLSIGMKFLQSSFYKKMGTIVSSDALFASAKDSLNDCITTVAVLISTLVYIFSNGKINIDSIALLVVSIFILVSSISLIKDTIDPLVGVIPSDEEVTKIANAIKAYDGVLGIHDLVVHSYGPNMNFVTVHVEVSREVDVMKSHDLIDNIEHEVSKLLNILLTIHMDPVEVNDEKTNEIKVVVKQILEDIDPKLSFHDFRIVPGPTHTNILFDVVMPFEYPITAKELKTAIEDKVKEHNETWNTVIEIDTMYSRNKH